MATLTLIRGLPGSGKSILGKEIAEVQGAIHLESDMFHIKNGVYRYDPKLKLEGYLWVQEECFKALEEGKDVVVSQCFAVLESLGPFFYLAKRTGASVKVIELLDGINYGTSHNVPDSVIADMLARFEPASAIHGFV